MESRKTVLKKLFIGQQWRNRQREQTYGHGVRGGEDELYGKITWKLKEKKTHAGFYMLNIMYLLKLIKVEQYKAKVIMYSQVGRLTII